jgi:hypothetical protein
MAGNARRAPNAEQGECARRPKDDLPQHRDRPALVPVRSELHLDRGWTGDAATTPNVIVAGVGALSLLVVSRLRQRRLAAESVASLLASYRATFFLQIGAAEAAALVGFIASFVTGSLWTYSVGLAFALAGLCLAAPSRSNIERGQEQLAAMGSPLSLGCALTSVVAPPDRPDSAAG